MKKLLLTSFVLFVTLDTSQGQPLCLNDSLSVTCRNSLSLDLNQRALGQKIKCGGFDIVNLKFYNERDTVIDSQEFRLIYISFETQYVKFGLRRKPNGAVELSKGYLLFKKSKNSNWILTEVFHEPYKELFRPEQRLLVSHRNY